MRTTTRKAHFLALDGLRGIAAIAILCLHQLTFVRMNFQIPAALAVDFFFMLSGFVLAYAYGSKLDNGLSWSRFMTARIIRLYPMLLFGITLGGLVAVKQAIEGFPLPHENGANFAATLLLLPVGLPFAGPAFLFNALIWSLFFEIAASAAYGTRLRNSHWGLFLAVGSIVLIGASVRAGSVTALGRQSGITFFGGFVRVAVPFAIGAAIYRTALFERFPKLPFTILAVVLLTLLLVPVETDWRYDLPCVFLAFPILICGGGNAGLSQLSERICRFLGRLSYPLYLVQLPVTETVGHFMRVRVGAQPIAVVAAAMLSSAAVAWGALTIYDEPIRGRLTKAVLSHQS